MIISRKIGLRFANPLNYFGLYENVHILYKTNKTNYWISWDQKLKKEFGEKRDWLISQETFTIVYEF